MIVCRGEVNIAARISSGRPRAVIAIVLVEISTLQAAALSACARASITSKYASGSISPPPSERGSRRR